MKEINSIQVFDCEEPVIFPNGWPALAAGKSHFGFKVIEQGGHNVWTEATEAEFRQVLMRYGNTNPEIDEAVSARLSLSGCNFDGTSCRDQCERGTHCESLLDIEGMAFYCACHVNH